MNDNVGEVVVNESFFSLVAANAELIAAAATIGILIVAWVQLDHMRKEAKRERTLTMCFAYDNDPVISKSVAEMREVDWEKECELKAHYVLTLLNYFDVLAIGETQGSYDFEIIYHQFKNIIPETTKWLKLDDEKDSYPDLIGLIEKIENRIRKERSAS